MNDVEVRHVTRTDGRTEFDEIVAENACVHLEKMNDGRFFLLIETQRERVYFSIFAKNPRGHIDAREYAREPVNRRSEAQKRRWSKLSGIDRMKIGPKRTKALKDARSPIATTEDRPGGKGIEGGESADRG
jgi:hypothetical protein